MTDRQDGLPDTRELAGYCRHCGAPLPTARSERDGWLFDVGIRMLIGPERQVVQLPRFNCVVFGVLWRRFGTMVSYESLIAAVFPVDYQGNERASLNTAVHKIRKLIVSTPWSIYNVWDEGWVLRHTGEAEGGSWQVG